MVLICSGPSFGAYHAVHFALRHSELVGRVLGMGGIYDITRFSAGFHDANVYHNNPMEYIANEQDPELLWGKQVWHAVRIWDGFAHDWLVWARVLPSYIGGHD